jgi:hypothetical protein
MWGNPDHHGVIQLETLKYFYNSFEKNELLSASNFFENEQQFNLWSKLL